MKRIIETQRLIIRNFKEDDLEDFIELTSNKKVCEMCNWPHFTDRETLKYSLIAQICKSLHFAIVLKNENKLVGAIELLNCKNAKGLVDEKTKEIAFMLNENYWNNGIMTEAIDAVVNYAFEVLNLTTIIGGYFEENNLSQKVQAKLGFKINNNKEIYNGNNQLIRYELTKEEYLNFKKGQKWQGKQKTKKEY